MTPVKDDLTHVRQMAADTSGAYKAPVWTVDACGGSVFDALLGPRSAEVFELVAGAPMVKFRPTLLGGFMPPVGIRHVLVSKIALLESLRDGWLGPGSVRPTSLAMRHYRDFLDGVGDFVTLDAEAVATADGAIRVEWETRAGDEKVIEFTPDGSAWLYESGRSQTGLAAFGDITCDVSDDTSDERTVDPFDVGQVVEFFHSGAR